MNIIPITNKITMKANKNTDMQVPRLTQKVDEMPESYRAQVKFEMPPDVFQKTLSPLRRENYVSGKNFKANLHIHSTFSDGELEPSEILEQAQKLSLELPENEKFIFSLTDHDTIDGAKEIARLISEEPKKYRKVKFIPGVEISGMYSNKGFLREPQEMDILLYGYDVNNKKLADFFKTRKENVTIKTKKLLAEVSLEDSEKLYEGLKKYSQYLKNPSTNIYLYLIREFLKTRTNLNDWQIDRLFLKYFKDLNCPFGEGSEFKNLCKLAHETNSTLVIAHPGRIPFEYKKKKKFSYEDVADELLKTVSRRHMGAEIDYAAYSDVFDRIRAGVYDKLIENDNYGIYKNIIKTGGQDTHHASIGSFLDEVG